MPHLFSYNTILRASTAANEGPAMDRDHPRRERTDMLAQDDIRSPEPVEQPVLHHGAGSGAQLLRRLEDSHQRPRPPRTVGGEFGDRRQQAGDVHVVGHRHA